jgi:transcription elongation factor Elf1
MVDDADAAGRMSAQPSNWKDAVDSLPRPSPCPFCGDVTRQERINNNVHCQACGQTRPAEPRRRGTMVAG